MTGFAFPMMFLLLAVPLIMRVVLPRVNDKNEDALKVPFLKICGVCRRREAVPFSAACVSGVCWGR